MRTLLMCVTLLLLSAFAPAQTGKTHELAKQELQQLIPQNYFFAGQTATTQLRNAGGIRFADNHLLLLALVDNSGYSTGIQQKYQGLLITEVALDVDGKTVPPGSYGFGTSSETHYDVLDINADEIAGGNVQQADAKTRAVPLRVSLNSDQSVTVAMGKRAFVLKRKQ